MPAIRMVVSVALQVPQLVRICSIQVWQLSTAVYHWVHLPLWHADGTEATKTQDGILRRVRDAGTAGSTDAENHAPRIPDAHQRARAPSRDPLSPERIDYREAGRYAQWHRLTRHHRAFETPSPFVDPYLPLT